MAVWNANGTLFPGWGTFPGAGSQDLLPLAAGDIDGAGDLDSFAEGVLADELAGHVDVGLAWGVALLR